MRNLNLVFLVFVLFSLSCNKIDRRIKLVEQLNGSYTGNRYNWSRGYDSTHTKVIEKFDTIRNVICKLQIDLKSNSIRFNDYPYDNHRDLNLLLDEDTIIAASGYYQPSTIMIVKSSKFIRYHYSKAGSSGPWAYSITEEYFRN